ncbi:bifunctional diaminohydroxyphosphoribosylaminopyrimidine deaminase/5-amino-6-(5-phosphoribosylamino)uracil reductase RibD [Natribacillus halophilus]|uniref:Riboflavin biosynthesis protein RibD n=1 Tax=Natribacillus halophilus TaxID=549003 RepID=A0A1G8KQD3_9BACI|nr:bifunctional diaminohydroxyphosphoribosylaminopyrimidine deaminase/5-amino-6-(5-phosphoribosylamino)uracil reductase RibD [Natribacillus halophilus]SDI45634.1 diaminohydroxyphosphoribosylaminopyrimidine deaminase [Natribacillus halophilus]
MNDQWYMQRALDLAATMNGQTTPNPMVGAVIVKDGSIIGTGAHMRAGEDHAEVHALKMAADRAAGATMYVSLEPCHHHGRTGPCTEKIRAAGIARVVVATKDLNGRGIESLRDANINVDVGVLEDQAVKLNEAFFHYMQTGKPFVTVKTASTLNGEMTTPKQVSKWITGEAARQEVHELRHMHDAILVGVGTVLEDDPALTTRLEVEGRHPLRLVLDRSLRTPMDAQLITDGEAPTWIFTEVSREDPKATQLEKNGVKIISMPTVTPNAVLKELGHAEIQTVLLEGGKKMIDAFIAEHEVQRYISYIGPKLFSKNGAVDLEVEDVRMVGEDVKVTVTNKRGDK